MVLTIALLSIGVLLSLAVLAVGQRFRAAGTVIYMACLAVNLVLLVAAGVHLISRSNPLTMRLPIGLPWIGANFRIPATATHFNIHSHLKLVYRQR